MAQVKQPLEENAIHRAKMWEIMMYALNNTSTNTYMMVVGYISYFLIGIVGLASVLAGSIVTIMRIWDGVTDPFVGMMVDKTNGKFGKNRPFIVIGQVIMFATTFVMFNFIPKTAIEFYEAVRTDDMATQHRLLKDFFMPYLKIRNRVEGYGVSIIKAGATIVGHSAGPVRAPLSDLKPSEVEELAALIKKLGPQ